MEALVVGSGPNGLVAAITLAQQGWGVTVLEAAREPGGGTRTEELTMPGVLHDVCSAVHPLAQASPALRSLPLADHGLEWIHPDVPLAHPLDGDRVALLHRSVDATAAGLGADSDNYHKLFGRSVDAGFDLTDGLLSPLRVPPAHPLMMARFGVTGIRPATSVGRRALATAEGRGLFGGLAAHSILSLKSPSTAAYGLMLGVLAHTAGWPVAKGGSRQLATALVALLESLGGRVECGHEVQSLTDLPSVDATLLDLTPRQVITIAGDQLPNRYARQLSSFRYGPGVFKMDWALDGPIPWASPQCLRAATVHLGGTLDEIAGAEDKVQRGGHPDRPFVLLAQPTLFDPTRAPDGVHTAWAYCHVPNGSTVDMTAAIEAQIERFAPGFGERVIGRHAMGPASMEHHDANYVGGDINGGMADLRQFVARPVLGLHPWRTPLEGVYLCSSSTPPGGGVHGMCGWHAAQEALRHA